MISRSGFQSDPNRTMSPSGAQSGDPIRMKPAQDLGSS
jgi:hypothetical protein